ncbi:MAG: NMD3-related protein [Promethearchaeota archaeon]
MPNRFCAICGNNIGDDSPHFAMCFKCYLKENPLFTLPKKFSFKRCVECGSYGKNEEWNVLNTDDISIITENAIKRYLLRHYIKKSNIEFDIVIDKESYKYSSRHLIKSFKVIVKGTVKNNEKIFHEQEILINLNNEICKNCSNLLSGTYYLSILQLRVSDETQFNKIKASLDDIKELVDKIFEKDSKHYISRLEDQKFGVDLYLSSNEILNRIISYLRPKYHFLLKRTKKLIGRDSQKGRNIYRIKALIKFLPFEIGNKLIIDNENFIVESITKNRVHIRDSAGNKLIKDFSYFFNLKKPFSII